MSSTKILSDLSENNLFDISIKTFNENELKDIYSLKKDDNSEFVIKRVLFYLFNYFINEKLNDNNRDLVISKYNNDLLNFLLNISKYKKVSNKFLDYSKSFNQTDLKSSVISLKLDFDNLMDKKNSIDTTIFANNLTELDKKVVASFSNMQQYLSLAIYIDNLRDKISYQILNIKFNNAEKSKNKKESLENLYQELKLNKQKKYTSLQNILLKITEQIQNQFSKILLNTNKLKMTDLTKSVQMFIKYNDEINQIYDKYLSSNDPLIKKSLSEAIEHKINNIDESLKSIKLKATNTLKEDFKYLFYLYELQSYHKIRIYQLNRDLVKNTDNLLSFINYMKDEDIRLKSLNIFSFYELNYLNLKNYILSSNNSQIYVHIKPNYSACIFDYDDNYLSGIIDIKINKLDKSYKLQMSEKSISDTSFNVISYLFSDIDSLIKFILSGFKKYDYLNIIG
jgi:hypothetical protein